MVESVIDNFELSIYISWMKRLVNCMNCYADRTLCSVGIFFAEFYYLRRITMRKTKIVCTIGTACESPQVLEKMYLAGRNVEIWFRQ